MSPGVGFYSLRNSPPESEIRPLFACIKNKNEKIEKNKIKNTPNEPKGTGAELPRGGGVEISKPGSGIGGTRPSPVRTLLKCQEHEQLCRTRCVFVKKHTLSEFFPPSLPPPRAAGSLFSSKMKIYVSIRIWQSEREDTEAVGLC